MTLLAAPEYRVCNLHRDMPTVGAFSLTLWRPAGFAYIISSFLLEHANYDVMWGSERALHLVGSTDVKNPIIRYTESKSRNMATLQWA